jgi:hypothetical protein
LELSGRTPAPRYVQFIVHGRSNDWLYIRTCVGSTSRALVAQFADPFRKYAEQRDACQTALPDHATTAPAAQLPVVSGYEQAYDSPSGMAADSIAADRRDSPPSPRRGTTTRCALSSLRELTQPQILVRDHGDITPELSGRPPTPCDVQFIGHGRSNDWLYGRTCVGSTQQALVAPLARSDHE